MVLSSLPPPSKKKADDLEGIVGCNTAKLAAEE